MKIGYFITARLKSSRLKRKILLPLQNQTILDHVINRCKATNHIDDVVLCTSTNPQDAELYDYALKHKIKFYAGSEDDVLLRLLNAAKYYGFDAFVSITADNPLHSVYVSNAIVDWVKREPLDFVFVSGLPIGLMSYYINTKAAEVAVKMKQKSDTEIWGPFVNRPDFFKIGYLNIKTELFSDDLRLTCDYAEDYTLLLDIYNKFPNNYKPTVFEVAALLNQGHVKITNKDVQQTSVAQEIIDEIKKTFDQYISLGQQTAERINHKLEPGRSTLTLKL